MDDPIHLKKHVVRGEKAGPHLLISAGVHGDEFTPMAAVRQLIQEVNPAVLSGTLTLVPVVNEAAFANRRRTAEDDLDVARICPGNPDGSVSERAAHAISELIQSADFYIDLHTGSYDFSLLPMTGYMMHEDSVILEKQREMARAFNLPVIWGSDARLDGRTLSVARDAGVPAIYGEYLGSGLCDERGVNEYVSGCLGVMNLLGMLNREDTEESRVERVVEDDRPAAGHMQTQNPAPAAGFFEAEVHLGDDVEKGALLGRITDPLADEKCEVRADRKGLILGLRTFSRVEKDELIAVILEPV